MEYSLTVIIVLGVVLGTAASSGPTYSPGCSFYGGQCVYSIKLGHKDQCDTPQSTAPASKGCCGDLLTKYADLKGDVDKLKTTVDVLTKTLTNSSKDGSGVGKELQKALAAREDILKILTQKESELKSTKAELAKVMSKAANEIKTLRDELTSAQTSYSTCRAALNGGDKTIDTTPNTRSGDYSMTYYNFNSQPKDFTFTKSMALLKQRSSHSTGPPVEHSWGVTKGSYLGIDAWALSMSKKSTSSSLTASKAESGTFPPGDAYCIIFWYYMEGSDVQDLTVDAKIKGKTGYPIFKKTGPSNSNKWELALIDLDKEYTQYQFQIDFTMTTKAYYSYYYRKGFFAHGNIAVDDLYVFNTSCSAIPRHLNTDSFYDGNTTSFYTFHFTPMTWTNAYDVCRREGPWSALVSIESSAEQKALVRMIQSNAAYRIIGAKGFYTSGSDFDSEQQFVWTNTGVQRDIKLDRWHAGQPNNVAGNQDCLLMEYPNDNFKWGDVDCNTKHPFICEVEVPGRVN